jgi:phage tail-like protein
MDKSFYPPVGFYFNLGFSDISPKTDNGFQEVSGLSIQMDLPEIEEGGLNSYKHKLPVQTKHENLVLKRGVVTEDSELMNWCKATLTSAISDPIKVRSLLLHLVDEKGQPVSSWSFKNAWPIKWDINSISAQTGSVFIETLEFTYTSSERIT